MSSLSLLNSSGVMPFLTLTAVFLFIGPVLIIGIATMWSNLKQKISDDLSARVIKILIDLGILNNIPKRSLHDQIFTELNDKFDTCISDINSIFTEKLDRINNDLNSKLTAEAEKNKARDDDFTKETHSMISTVTEGSIGSKKPVVMILETFRPNLHQSKLLLKFFKMIWPNIMKLSKEPISINKACSMNLKLMNLN